MMFFLERVERFYGGKEFFLKVWLQATAYNSPLDWVSFLVREASF